MVVLEFFSSETEGVVFFRITGEGIGDEDKVIADDGLEFRALDDFGVGDSVWEEGDEWASAAL